ncbi:LacI family DNA-binding transcriptional regulator [Kineococcus rhizosphaerae]|uniref:LacI family transcriptional regulator n=1 Tax=Kineococcus rhizosphaerae TaxID=559628 RepID=A0A2T0R326_9ACTN|nr:LacI family DNA-binding transcriptional regulator [Kineococcus rhizosphaerae]PRY14444.1 LacI family transcriptional regulator [Kineococcus rhizosphaerae]
MLDSPRAHHKTTLATIAASAGVSIATVSKVVNGREDVSPETRALVEELLVAHDYSPPSARRPNTVSATVEFLIDGDFSSYATTVVDGVVDAAREAGAAVVVGLLREQRAGRYPGPPRSWARSLAQAGRTGVIVVTGELTGAHVDALAAVNLPLVVIDPLNLPRREVASVGSTNFTGGMSATNHLLAQGHRNIAWVGGPPGSQCNQARLHGYRAAMESAGLAPDPLHILNEDFRYDAGRRLGHRLLAGPDRPTAVVGGCDSIALGIMEAARTLGLRVPDDLSVTGFDDTELAPMAAPPLTTVRQPLRDMGRVALRTVLRMASGEQLDSHHVELATELVVRGSTAPLR